MSIWRRRSWRRISWLLERIVRYRPYTLSPARKRSSRCRARWPGRPGKAFRQLLDADLKFGDCEEREEGSRSSCRTRTFSKLLRLARAERAQDGVSSVLRAVRGAREHARRDADRLDSQGRLLRQGPRLSRARCESALFPDNVPQAVYDNLIAAVRKHLPAVHRYYDVRRRKMKLQGHSSLRHLRADPQRPGDQAHTGKQAVKLVIDSLAAAGRESIARMLEEGLHGRWCDRYPEPGQAAAGHFPAARTTAALHPDELQRGGLQRRLHAGPRSGPLHAHLAFGQDISRTSTTTT